MAISLAQRDKAHLLNTLWNGLTTKVVRYKLDRLLGDCKVSNQNPLTFHLNAHKHKYYHLWEPKPCCECPVPSPGSRKQSKQILQRDEWNSLFEEKSNGSCCCKTSNNGKCPAKFQARNDISSKDLDLTLGCLLLTTSLSPGKTAVECICEIRKLRNETLGHRKTHVLSNEEFIKIWVSVTIQLERIAETISDNYFYEIKTELAELAFGIGGEFGAVELFLFMY